jgi:hypothetical protein
MVRKKTVRSQLYRAARDMGNVEAVKDDARRGHRPSRLHAGGSPASGTGSSGSVPSKKDGVMTTHSSSNAAILSITGDSAMIGRDLKMLVRPQG